MIRTNEILYMVTYAGKPMACGTLTECWRFIVEAHGKDAKVVELLGANITVEPAPVTMKAGLVG